MKCIKRSIFAACIAAVGFSSSANAALIGDTISGTGSGLAYAGGDRSATVGSGIEFSGMFGLVNFDFSNTLLTLTVNKKDVSWSSLGSYVFSGFSDTITGFSLSSLNTNGNSGFTGFDAGDLSFGAHSLAINIDSGYVRNKNSTIYFDITTVPTALTEVGTGFPSAPTPASPQPVPMPAPLPPVGMPVSFPDAPTQSAEVAEPSSLALLGLGLLAFAALRHKAGKANNA